MQNTAASTSGRVHVAVAVVRNSLGQVLITQRHADAHQGGLWEFPGGKVESGETLEQALRRELAEELAIDVRVHRPLLQITHDYGDKLVLLDVCEILGFDGEARPCEGQPMRWVELEALPAYDFPAANREILAALLSAGEQDC
ncbi:MAG: 8-oxo-dGTP diphosphatase MutT [Congregibacter sp.]